MAGIRVLLVDDNQALRENLQECLEAAGHHVATASEGGAALAEMERGQLPNVVVVDLMMPGMDGRELVAAIRRSARHRGLRLVLITGHDEAERAGIDADAVLVKPFGVDELLAAIGEDEGAPAR